VLLAPSEYRRLLEYRIGLTDLCKVRSGSDRAVGSDSFDVARLAGLVKQYRPGTLAFNGKKAAQATLGHRVDYGRQPEKVAGACVFVLPSTSSSARRYWDVGQWHALAADVA
jgi:double-stranded uracil-DNA glycosylase